MFLYAYRLPYLALNICFGINEKTWSLYLPIPTSGSRIAFHRDKQRREPTPRDIIRHTYKV